MNVGFLSIPWFGVDPKTDSDPSFASTEPKQKTSFEIRLWGWTLVSVPPKAVNGTVGFEVEEHSFRSYFHVMGIIVVLIGQVGKMEDLLSGMRPTDWLDFCCYCHDIGYDAHDQETLLKADLAFLECLERPHMSIAGDPYIAQLYKTMSTTGQPCDGRGQDADLRLFFLPSLSQYDEQMINSVYSGIFQPPWVVADGGCQRRRMVAGWWSDSLCLNEKLLPRVVFTFVWDRRPFLELTSYVPRVVFTSKAKNMEQRVQHEVEDNAVVLRLSEQSQLIKGNNLSPGYVSDLIGYTYINLYGDIAYLLDIPIDRYLFRALSQFWNPSYSFFTVGKVNLTPTMEEYQALIRDPRCGEHDWVLLPGIWGSIGYAHLMVSRQYRLRQFIPATSGHLDAWKLIHRVNLFTFGQRSSQEYKQWRIYRVNDNLPMMVKTHIAEGSSKQELTGLKRKAEENKEELKRSKHNAKILSKEKEALEKRLLENQAQNQKQKMQDLKPINDIAKPRKKRVMDDKIAQIERTQLEMQESFKKAQEEISMDQVNTPVVGTITEEPLYPPGFTPRADRQKAQVIEEPLYPPDLATSHTKAQSRAITQSGRVNINLPSASISQQHIENVPDFDQEEKKESNKQLEQLMEEVRVMKEGSSLYGIEAKELSLMLDLVLPPKFKIPDFENFDGNSFKSFTDIVTTGEMIEMTVKSGKLESEAQGHSIENYIAFKRIVQSLRTKNVIYFGNNEQENVAQNPLPNYAGAGINVVVEEKGKQISEVKSHMFWIWVQMIKVGLLKPNSLEKRLNCGNVCHYHCYEGHVIQQCPDFWALVQKMMDEKEIEFFKEVLEEKEMDICASEGSSREVYNSNYPLIITPRTCVSDKITPKVVITSPSLFPYKENKQVPWNYDYEIPSEMSGSPKALHITVKCKGHILSRVLVDNGSALNVMPLVTLKKLPVDSTFMKNSQSIVRAFDGTKKEMEICLNAEEDIIASVSTTAPYVELDEEAIECSFRSLDFVNTIFVAEGKRIPKPKISNCTKLRLKLTIGKGAKAGKWNSNTNNINANDTNPEIDFEQPMCPKKVKGYDNGEGCDLPSELLKIMEKEDKKILPHKEPIEILNLGSDMDKKELSEKCNPIFRLLKKSNSGAWNEECQEAFETDNMIKPRKKRELSIILARSSLNVKLDTLQLKNYVALWYGLQEGLDEDLISISVEESVIYTIEYWKLTFDGSSNALGHRIGAILVSPNGEHYMFTCRLNFDYKNNMAEYEACILGLRAFIERKVKMLKVYEDSALVIYQIRGEWETKDSKLIKYHKLVMELIKEFEEVTFNYLPKEENQMADALATWQLYLKYQSYPDQATENDKRTIRRIASGMHTPPHPLHVMIAPWPFSIWGIDVIGQIFPNASNGHCFILVAIDYFTKWVEATSYANITQSTVFCEQFQIKYHNSTTYRPKMNGAIEAANKNIKRLIEKMIETYKDWHEKLPFALLAY
ncbi:Detected protein of unknown function [Hibiscus syriacus]|uniref:Uncharacterized protein n=1 Tax=Hibiscus syriacus TaxID=106335 RepID=A0A6A2Y250_HIBSY|nr:Detected protein of unknown function [Hibiscus syriacus]